MKILGIDYGSSKIGLAIGDTETGLAFPFKILENKGPQNILTEIKDFCLKEKISMAVVGMPVNPGVEPSAQVDIIKKFIVNLKSALSFDVVSQDERFTTQEAIKMKRKGEDDDALSAMLIVQSYLDSVR